jgi:hypothetical protein
MPERVKISANSWAEQKRVAIISANTSFDVWGYDQPDPTAANASSRPVGFWLKEFIASRANGLGYGRKFGSVEGRKPIFCVHCGLLVGRLVG